MSSVSRNGTLLADEEKGNLIEKTLHFSQPTIEKKGTYAIVKSIDANNVLRKEGFPFIPSYVETFTLPIGTKISGVEVQASQPREMDLSEKIIPSSPAVSYNMKASEIKIVESDVYKSDNIYPERAYEWHVGVGIEDGKHVIFLSVQLYPVRYIPAKNELMLFHMLLQEYLFLLEHIL